MKRLLLVFLASFITLSAVSGEDVQDPNTCEPNVGSGEILFCFEADGEILSTPAVTEEGAIYFGTLNATFYAVDCNGALKWEWKYDCPYEGFWCPQAFEGSPAIARDGTIYVGDDVATPNFFFALSPEGMKEWEYETRVVYGSMDASPVLLSDGTIFAGAHGYSGWVGYVGQIVALAPDGTVLNGFPLDTMAITASPVAISDVAYFAGETGYGSSKIIAVNKNAEILWETTFAHNSIDDRSYLSSLAVDDKKSILVAQNAFNWPTQVSSSRIVQLSPLNGEVIFEMPVQTRFDPSPREPALAMPEPRLAHVVGSPIIDATAEQTHVIVATHNAHVISLNPYTSGEAINYDLVLSENGRAIGSPVIGDNGKLYHAINSVGDANQIDIFEINPDGTINESFGVTISNDHVSSSLTMDSHGVLYFGTKEGRLYAIQTNAQGLSTDSPWPTFRHDMRNTGNARLCSAENEDSDRASMPYPAFGSVDVSPDSVAAWHAGRDADQHIIYVSTDVNAVIEGTAASVTSDANSIDLTVFDLLLGEAYYWRVDEVNEAEATPVKPGPVWYFSTSDCLVVDDFEHYTNWSPNRVFMTWEDGYGYGPCGYFPDPECLARGNDSGAALGHDIWSTSSPHFKGSIMETSIVHSGRQSVPFYATPGESGLATYSQADLLFEQPQDWKAHGIETLVLYFFGDPCNTGGPLYVKVNDQKVIYADSNDLTVPVWHQWAIDLDSLQTDLQNVTSLHIGIEGPGTSGIIYIDDIGLCREVPAPAVSSLQQAVFKKEDYLIE